MNTLLLFRLNKRSHIGGFMTLSVNHFNLRLVVEEAGSEMNISDVDILWHVLSKCI